MHFADLKGVKTIWDWNLTTLIRFSKWKWELLPPKMSSCLRMSAACPLLQEISYFKDKIFNSKL